MIELIAFFLVAYPLWRVFWAVAQLQPEDPATQAYRTRGKDTPW